MGARDHDATSLPRTVTSCASCLAWGLTYAQGVCLACYNFAAPGRGHLPGECAACHRWQRLKKGYCRLCWCQAREDRTKLATDARSAVVLAPYLAGIRWHQLFLSISDRRQAPPRKAPRRYGVKGRPRKHAPPVAGRPVSTWVQPCLLPAGPRDYRAGAVDLRTGPPPDNPWLAWALHLAHAMGETRGWKPTAQRAMQRTLVALLADHREPDRIRVSDVTDVVAQQYINLDYVVEILTIMDIVDDDRPAALENLMATKVAHLPIAWRSDLLAWARTLRDGGPRIRARHESTVRTYLTVTVEAATTWPGREHLREVTRDDVLTYLATLQGRRRQTATTALRALFQWAKRNNTIFRNPTHAIAGPRVADPIWQPLRPEQITASVTAATTPQAKLCVVLAAVHAARPGQIRALHLDDVDLAGRRITIAGNSRPLDELTSHVLLDWLNYRRQRWPHTANRHLLVSTTSALGHQPVSHAWIRNLRGLPTSLERLRIDRHLEEAIATGGDPLHLAAVFGLSEGTAIRWAANARELLSSTHADRPLGSP